jgi:hypothetical protein
MNQQQSPQIRVYISNALAHQELATRLRYDLEANGFLTRSDEDMRIGRFVFEEVREAIEGSHVVILIEGFGESVESYAVGTEFGFARMYHRPMAILQMRSTGELKLSLLLWPSGSSAPEPVVGYDQALTAIIQALNALRTEVERENASTLRVRITEPELTAQNLTTIISALTELSTKYWLIAKGRFADLIEYTQTRNGRFAEEAGMVITRVTYNSPLNMDLKVDLSASSVAEALVTTIDGITQAPKRLKQKELENQAKAQEIRHSEQQAAHEQQMAALEQEQRRLEIEKQRLEVLEKQLEVQKKGIEYALEIAGKVVDLLHPGADPATRAMEIQVLLPNLVQLQNGKGLELALP